MCTAVRIRWNSESATITKSHPCSLNHFRSYAGCSRNSTNFKGAGPAALLFIQDFKKG